MTEWRFAPGAATGWHRHEMDYVIVPMADGELELVGPDGERTRAQLGSLARPPRGKKLAVRRPPDRQARAARGRAGSYVKVRASE